MCLIVRRRPLRSRTEPVASIEYQGRRLELAPGETVLDGLLAAGVDAPHSCRSGHCRTCVARALDVAPPAGSQEGLKDSWRELGLFLTCRAVPTEDMRIAATDDLGLEVGATVTAVERLSHDVVRLRLETDEPFEHRGGQFVTLVRVDGLARSYSTANVPGRDGFIELHVREIANGAMSGWIARELKPGGRVAVRGPEGECFYVHGRPEQPLLLVGTGTGLAPLFAILQEALAHAHSGRIVLLQGAVDERGLYLVDELRALAKLHPNFEYVRCLLRGEAQEGIEIGAIDAILRARIPALRGWRAYLCGNPELVFDLRKKVFLGGANSKEIHADAFVMKAPALAR
ncbi:MAG: 2Fe-2S iron-sulfur cluster binding domain-containing protein [Planctomycetes bacterium]|nr:2Fe-2S iron-sulfur cluster binding domain-containing protein [Planctomycetota bacterium]